MAMRLTVVFKNGLTVFKDFKRFLSNPVEVVGDAVIVNQQYGFNLNEIMYFTIEPIN